MRTREAAEVCDRTEQGLARRDKKRCIEATEFQRTGRNHVWICCSIYRTSAFAECE